MSIVDPTDPDLSATRASAPPHSIWRNADLLRVLAGETSSDLGSQIGDFALPLAAALALQATPGQMAAISVAEYIPRIVVGPVAGVWIDRLRRKPVLIATNVVRGLLFLALAMAAAFGWLRMELLYGVGLVMAALGVVFETALVAYLPSLVTPPLLVAANGARATSSAATDVVGPGACGVLVQLLGTPVAVALDGVSFLASATGIALVRCSEPAPPPRRQRLRTDVELLAGMRALAGNPILRAFVATAFTANFFYRVIMATYVLYLTRELALPPAAVGIIFGLGGGTGVLVGSAVASSVARSFGLGRTLVVAHFLFGVLGIPLLLAVVWPAQAAPLVFASEFAQLSVNAVYMVNRVSVEQAVTPPRLRGRIQASRTVAHALSGVVGLVLGGVLAEQVGVGAAISVGVTGGLFSFLWLSRSPILRVRDLSRIPELSTFEPEPWGHPRWQGDATLSGRRCGAWHLRRTHRRSHTCGRAGAGGCETLVGRHRLSRCASADRGPSQRDGALETMSPERPAPLLVAMRGMPGVGKSVLARAISLEFGWPVLDKDDIKDVVHGRADAPDRLAYDLQFRLARRQLQQGLGVVCDSPMLHPGVYALAAQSADEAGARLVVLECVLGDAAEHRRRIEARGLSNRLREWAINDWAAFVEYRDRTLAHASYEIDVPRLVVDLSQPEEQATSDSLKWLRGLMEVPSAWMAREQWEALVRGKDCPLCGDIASSETENAYGFFVGDLRMSRLMLAREYHVPGRCVLMCRRHVREPHELSAVEQRAFFGDMLRVGKILEQVYDALKMNYQILGNAVPHLHAHIQPRYFGDPFPGQPVGGPLRQPVLLSPAEYRQQVEAIRAALEMDSNRRG